MLKPTKKELGFKQAWSQLHILRGGHESKQTNKKKKERKKEKQGQNFLQVNCFKEIQRVQIIKIEQLLCTCNINYILLRFFFSL